MCEQLTMNITQNENVAQDRSQFRFQWLMHGIKCVRTNPSMIPNMLHAFERGPIDLRAMSFAQNRLISGEGSEEQMRIFPKLH